MSSSRMCVSTGTDMVSTPSSLWYCLATKQNCSLASQILRVSLEERSSAPEGPSLPFQVAPPWVMLVNPAVPGVTNQKLWVPGLCPSAQGQPQSLFHSKVEKAFTLNSSGQSLFCKPQSRLCLGPLHRNVPRLALLSLLHMAWAWVAWAACSVPARVWTPHFCLTGKTLPSKVHCTSHNTPLPWQEMFLSR